MTLSVLGGPARHGLVSLSQTRLWSCDQIGWFSVIVVSVCLPPDALSQHLPSYLGFSHLGCKVPLHAPDLRRGVVPLRLASIAAADFIFL